MNEVRRGTVISFNATLWQANILLDGADVDAIIPVGQWVPAAMMAVDAVVAVLIFGDTNTNDGVVIGAYGAGAASSWSYPALSALTTGQPLRATSATAAAYGALDLANVNAVTGVLPIANGGLALSAAPASGQVPIGNGTIYVLATITGTANRVTVANGAGTITLSGPQDLHTAATPTFGGLNLGAASGAASGELKLKTLTHDQGANEYSMGITLAVTSTQTNIANHPVAIFTNTDTTANNGINFRFNTNDTSAAAHTGAGIGAQFTARTSTTVTGDLYFYTVLANIISEVARFTSGKALNLATGAVIQVNAVQVLSARKTGYTNAWITTAAERAAARDAATITLVQLAQRVRALQDDLVSHGLIGP